MFCKRWSFSQPRPNSVLLRCQSRCRITGRGCELDAYSIVRDGTSLISVTALDDLNFFNSRNLGRSLLVLGRVAWLAVSPLTGPVITTRMVAASGPLAPPRITVLRVLNRGKRPVPVVPGARLTTLPCKARHLNTEQECIGQQTVCPRTINVLRENNHMQQRIPRDMRTHDGHRNRGLQRC